MKLHPFFIVLLVLCASFTNAGDGGSADKQPLPETPHSRNEMLQNPDLPPDQTTSCSLVYPGKDGHLVYKPYTDKGDRILDFSYCGFKRSEERIPNVPVVVRLNPLPGEAIPDGTMAYPKGRDSRGPDPKSS